MSGTSDGTLPCVCSKRASLTAWDPFLEFDDKYLKNLDKLRREDAPNDGTTTYANLAFGNPQDPPLPELVEALKRQIEKAEPPHGRPDAFEYKVRLPESVDAVVNALMRTRSLQVDPDDVMLTNGALAALSLSAFVLGDPGDEAIMLTPSYFFYRPTIEYAGLIAVPVPSNAKEGFALDVEAIRGAISPKTRLILLNSPNNPTGKIYSMESLRALSSMLQDINLERRKTATDHYQPIVVISDEAYCRIVFDDIEFHSIAEVYPYSIMVYTWGKTLLAPR
jgi:aspartate aminotransferase